MFRVDVDTLEAYFAFDPIREADLRRSDALITKAAPCLKRYFPQGGAGAGESRHALVNDWVWQVLLSRHDGRKGRVAVVGVALQKNYISVYFAVTKRRAAVTDPLRR